MLNFINIIIYSLAALPYSRAELSVACIRPGTPMCKNVPLHSAISLESFASVNGISGKLMLDVAAIL